MDGRQDVRPELRLDRPAPLLRHAELPPEQCLRCGCAETDEHLRLDSVEFRVEARPAGCNLRPRGLGMDAPFPARLPLEVLDNVRYVGARPVDAGLLERLVEQAPGRPDEWASLEILPVAGLFADEHHVRSLQALAEDRL